MKPSVLCCRHACVSLLVQQWAFSLPNPPVLAACALAPGCLQVLNSKSCQGPLNHSWPCAAVLRRLPAC